MLVNLKVDQLARELTKMSVTESIKRDKMIKEKQAKVKISNEYYKEKDNLKRFLLQWNLYMWHNQAQFKKINKIMFAITYIRDKIFWWIQSHLKDVLIKESNDQS